MNSIRLATSILACSSLILCRCGAATEDVEEPPVPVAYELEFSSVAAAVAVDNIRVTAYPLNEAVSCQDLVNMRRNDLDLPIPAAQTDLFSPCDVRAGAGGMEVAFGEYAVLAVAFQGSTPMLIGCGAGSTDNGSSPIGVSFTLFNNQVSIPQTTCVHLEDKCLGACP